MTTAGLFAQHGTPSDALGDGDHRRQVRREVPARVVGPTPLDLDVLHSLGEGVEFRNGVLQLAPSPDNADVRLHHLLEIALNVVGVFALLALEGCEGLFDGGVDRRFIETGRTVVALDEVSRPHSGSTAEDDEVGE